MYKKYVIKYKKMLTISELTISLKIQFINKATATPYLLFPFLITLFSPYTGFCVYHSIA